MLLKLILSQGVIKRERTNKQNRELKTLFLFMSKGEGQILCLE